MTLADCLWLAALTLPRGSRAHLDGELALMAAVLLMRERPWARA